MRYIGKGNKLNDADWLCKNLEIWMQCFSYDPVVLSSVVAIKLFALWGLTNP